MGIKFLIRCWGKEDIRRSPLGERESTLDYEKHWNGRANQGKGGQNLGYFKHLSNKGCVRDVMRYRRKRSQVIFYAVFSKLEHLASLALTKTPCGGEGVVSTLRLRKLCLKHIKWLVPGFSAEKCLSWIITLQTLRHHTTGLPVGRRTTVGLLVKTTLRCPVQLVEFVWEPTKGFEDA